MRFSRFLFTLVVGLASAPALSAPSKPTATATTPRPWCVEGTETLANDVCAFAPAFKDASHTLLIYLHGVIKPGTGWQYAPERGMQRIARQHHVTVLMPRGRRGIGPHGMHDWWTWPTSARAQRAIETQLIDEWQQARQALERRNGHPFEHVYVLGFSNGAYYASSLALRGRLHVNGYAIIAGGNAPRFRERAARTTKWRPPVYVGYGYRDHTAVQDCSRLARALRRLHWPRRVKGRRRVGHTVTDAQVAEAFAFFRRYEKKHPGNYPVGMPLIPSSVSSSFNDTAAPPLSTPHPSRDVHHDAK